MLIKEKCRNDRNPVTDQQTIIKRRAIKENRREKGDL